LIRLIGSVMNQFVPAIEHNGVTHHHKVQDASKNFQTFLMESLEKVNQLQVQAEQLNQQLALGQAENLHDVMIASEKAGLSLQLVIQIRNRVVEAYQEIMRMQI